MLGTLAGARLDDLMIAAIALAGALALATRDVDEFQRVPGLMVEGW